MALILNISLFSNPGKKLFHPLKRKISSLYLNTLHTLLVIPSQAHNHHHLHHQLLLWFFAEIYIDHQFFSKCWDRNFSIPGRELFSHSISISVYTLLVFPSPAHSHHHSHHQLLPRFVADTCMDYPFFSNSGTECFLSQGENHFLIVSP